MTRRARPPFGRTGVTSTPPRLAAWLAGRVAVHLPWRETTLGDLHEEFLTVRARRGPHRARLWYWRQAARLAADASSTVLRGLRQAALTLIRPAGDRPMQSFMRELRLALRTLRRQPLTTGIIIGTLALGLGANAATFGMIDHLLLRPFTFDDVDRLVYVAERSPADGLVADRDAVAPANYHEWREQAKTVEQMSSFRWWDVNLSGRGIAERVQGTIVSGDFFALLGADAARGRLLTPADDVEGEDRRVVISDGLWQRRFGADPDIVGETVQLDALSFEVVGVAEPGFDFPNGTEIWAPTADDPAASHSSTSIGVAARLQPGESLERARAELQGLFEAQRTRYPTEIRDRVLEVESFTTGLVDVGLPRILVLWQATAVLVLLIGCVNVANLLLARGAERARELAVRLAIGAGRAHLVRQLLIESLVLALLASPAALAVAWGSFALIRAAMPAELLRFVPGWDRMGIDATAAAFTVGIAVVTSVVFGLLPALRASRPGLNQTLRDGGRSASAGVARSRLRRGLVVAQIAVALPLLVLSGLSATATNRFSTGPQGYDPDGVLRMRTRLVLSTYPDADARRRFVDRLLDEAAGVPGVETVAAASTLPSSTSFSQREIVVDGQPVDPERPVTAGFRAVSAQYLDTLRIPVLRGRGFAAADREDTQPVALVTESMARRHWPDGGALGARLRFSAGDDAPWFTVIGVVGDTIDDWFALRRSPTAYVPIAQAPSSSIWLVARTSRDPASLTEGLRTALARVDAHQAGFEISTMTDAIWQRTTGLRFVSGLMLAFGLLALVLASFGIYGVMAHYVAQRRHEIGVRMALGASAVVVLRQTLAQGARLAVIGIVIGVAAGVALARVMENALFGIIAVEPSLFAAVVVALGAVALAASLVPARQATRVDPVVVLRG